MVAEFIGTDGSMGLRRGQTYNITITEDSHYIWVKWSPKNILDAAAQLLGAMPFRCPYTNEASLRENWNIMR